MKILKSRKALSPVVASIILIAVTVAVSIAVAAWMGALTFNFTATEELKITQMTFGTPATMMNITMQNTGTTPITINEVHVNNGAANLLASPFTVAANSQTTQTITLQSPGWTAGSTYQVKLVSAKGNQFLYTAVAPSS